MPGRVVVGAADEQVSEAVTVYVADGAGHGAALVFSGTDQGRQGVQGLGPGGPHQQEPAHSTVTVPAMQRKGPSA